MNTLNNDQKFKLGAEKGSCKNCDNDQRCECNVKNGWFYNNETQLCDCNSAICINPNSAEKQACSGRGKCVCDKCVCDQPVSIFNFVKPYKILEINLRLITDRQNLITNC